MAEAYYISSLYSYIEIDEDGNIWQSFNPDSNTAIFDLQSVYEHSCPVSEFDPTDFDLDSV